jgi:hypothetical protein
VNAKSAVLFASVLTIGGSAAAQAQSADKVIERYIEAIGGESAVEKIDSTEAWGSIRAADGRAGVFVQRTRRPHMVSVSLSWNDSYWRAGFNGRSAWQDDGVTGVRTLYGEAASRARAEALYSSTRLLLPEKINRVSVVRRDRLRDRPVIVMTAVIADGMTRTLFFDSDNYLLVKDEMPGDGGVAERFFDDYRPVDGVMEPHRIEWHQNGEVFRIAVERITHNAPIDEAAFDVPAPDVPSVDVDTLLDAAARIEENAARLRTSYAYTQLLSFRTMDQQGRVKERDGSAFEIFHLGGRAVGRQIRKPDGRALSEAEQRLEDRRVKDLVTEYERRGPSGPAGSRLREDLDVSGFLLRNLWGSLVLRVPVMTTGWLPAYRRVSEFNRIRRERMGPRAAVVMDFQPKSGVAPAGDIERQAGRMAGTLWIDEASQQVVRIESYFVDDYDSIVQGSSVRMEQTLVNGEVWLPSRLEANLRRSLRFGAVAQPLITVRFTDHKQFGVETDTAVELPDAAR